MFYGQYVDTNLLEKGIYTCSKPNLYSKDTTIELIEQSARMMKDVTGELFISECYFDNLRKCELVDVTLKS